MSFHHTSRCWSEQPKNVLSHSPISVRKKKIYIYIYITAPFNNPSYATSQFCFIGITDLDGCVYRRMFFDWSIDYFECLALPLHIQRGLKKAKRLFLKSDMTLLYCVYNVFLSVPSIFRLFTRWCPRWWRCLRTSPHLRNAQTRYSDRWTRIETVSLLRRPPTLLGLQQWNF